MKATKTDPLIERMDPVHRRFAEGVASGLSGFSAIKAAGYPNQSEPALRSAVTRFSKLDDVQRAIRILRTQSFGDGSELMAEAEKTLKELLAQTANPNARAKAVEMIFRLNGKLGPQGRHAATDAPSELHDAPIEEKVFILTDTVRRILRTATEAERNQILEFLTGETDEFVAPSMFRDGENK